MAKSSARATLLRISTLALALTAGASAQEPSSFVNWETPHVRPLAVTPNGARLLAVNTADGRLEVFSLASGLPVHEASIPVGVDPVSVSVRPGAPDEAWVVNHVSDSVSVVDLGARRVRATLATADEPADVVFAGVPQRAFVSCSQANRVQVFDPSDLTAAPVDVPIDAEDPRALAVSNDRMRVHVAVFESGNGTTILAGGIDNPSTDFPLNVVTDPAGPYGGVNPPPNRPTGFEPVIAPGLPTPPEVGLIVRKVGGSWVDDRGTDWTALVSGAQSALSDRPAGWDLPDRDVATIDAATLQVTYASGLMNLCMALAVHPVSGEVVVVGTDATNDIRFEPNLTGTFVRVHLARVDPTGTSVLDVVDLNDHLTYASSSVPQAQRDLSLGDPRGIAWTPDGSRAFVTGMGSNNVVVLDAQGARAGVAPTIEVGEGPTGVVMDPVRNRVYVLNKFEASVSAIQTATEQVLSTTSFFDPTPAAIRNGRRHLYSTHDTSGLGQISCGSCHIDARMDRLAWDLGNPAGAMKSIQGQNLFMGDPLLAPLFEDWHPMKGPMTTQTLQDIIGKEPLHWRGDKDGLEEFNGAFVGLQGDDAGLSPVEMQEFEDFLATIHFPPNPFRNLDNTLSDDLPLPGHFATGDFAPAGTPLPNGDAQRGEDLFRPPNFLGGGLNACSKCHTIPTGVGSNTHKVGLFTVPFPIGPNGEEHTSLTPTDGFTNKTIKIAQLRNLYDKVGFDLTQTENRAGFGFLHDGVGDSLARFVGPPAFLTQSLQDIADLVAFLLSFSGSDLEPPLGDFLEPVGPLGRDTHAAVGAQVTIAEDPPPAAQEARLLELVALADAGAVGLVAKSSLGPATPVGWAYLGSGVFQSDRAAVTHSLAVMQSFFGRATPITFTAVPAGSEVRVGIDRDEDGAFDGDELDAGTDPADASSVPCTSAVPGAPRGLAATALGAHAVELTWTNAGGGEEAVVVMRRRVGSPGRPFHDVAVLIPGTTGFVDGGLACKTRYEYRVRAETCAGASASGAAQAATDDCAAVNVDVPVGLPR